MSKIENSKRLKLIASASDLFLSGGYNNTSIKDISKKAGVPLSNVYYYFKTKKLMLQAVLNLDDYKDIRELKFTPETIDHMRVSRLMLEMVELNMESE